MEPAANAIGILMKSRRVSPDGFEDISSRSTISIARFIDLPSIHFILVSSQFFTVSLNGSTNKTLYGFGYP